MTFGKRNRCCCDAIESPCDCTGSFTTFQVVIADVTDEDCVGNASGFNGTHTFDRGDGDCNDPHNTDLCWGRKFFKGSECLYISCSYGVGACPTQAADTGNCEDMFCDGGYKIGEGCACSAIQAFVRESPTDSVNNILLQVRLTFINQAPLDVATDYAIFEADIAKSACTDVFEQPLTLSSSNYIDDNRIYCYPEGYSEPCGKCIDFDLATVELTLT
jgi:hypothetical protein